MSRKKAPTVDPFLMQSLANAQPQTQLPQSMVPNAPPVLSPMQVQSSALEQNAALPFDLRVTSDNPVFGQNAATEYQNKVFDQAIQPMLDKRRAQMVLQGRDPGENTFAGTEYANASRAGALDAFDAGQQFRQQEIGNTFGRRDSLYGQEGRIAQEQNAADVTRGLNLENQTTQRLDLLNNAQRQSDLTRLGALGAQTSLAAANAANRTRQLAAIGGIAGGIGKSFLGSPMAGNIGYSLGSAFMNKAPGLASFMFGGGKTGF